MPILAYNEAVPEKPDDPRKLLWLVDSLDRLSSFPPVVRKKLGFALYQAQIGQQHESAKMLRDFVETVWQVRADDPEQVVHVLVEVGGQREAAPVSGHGEDAETDAHAGIADERVHLRGDVREGRALLGVELKPRRFDPHAALPPQSPKGVLHAGWNRPILTGTPFAGPDEIP